MVLAFAALLAAALEPPQPPEIGRTAEAFAACLGDRLAQAEDNVRPAVIVDAMLAHCRPQQEAAMAAHARWVNGLNISDRDKAEAIRAAQRSQRGLRAQLIADIRDRRRRR